MRVDSHQHFWELGRFDYAWMPPEPSILRQSYLPDVLGSVLSDNRMDGSVTVQATTDPGEADWLLQLAAELKEKVDEVKVGLGTSDAGSS